VGFRLHRDESKRREREDRGAQRRQPGGDRRLAHEDRDARETAGQRRRVRPQPRRGDGSLERDHDAEEAGDHQRSVEPGERCRLRVDGDAEASEAREDTGEERDEPEREQRQARARRQIAHRTPPPMAGATSGRPSGVHRSFAAARRARRAPEVI
jgi:hypothetical protein